ncbi:MAG: methyltransferase domain-containing protein, partial [Thermodesulfobacteriota bacterium]|nr:methyltransferase domain-containing protein [Thermodesulfobacteriota bacterium]
MNQVKTRSVKKIYDHYSPIYDFIFKGWFYPRIKYAIGLLDLKPGDRILEVGIGTGLSMTTYPQHCDIVGIDLSRQMIKKAENKKEKY